MRYINLAFSELCFFYQVQCQSKYTFCILSIFFYHLSFSPSMVFFLSLYMCFMWVFEYDASVCNVCVGVSVCPLMHSRTSEGGVPHVLLVPSKYSLCLVWNRLVCWQPRDSSVPSDVVVPLTQHHSWLLWMCTWGSELGSSCWLYLPSLPCWAISAAPFVANFYTCQVEAERYYSFLWSFLCFCCSTAIFILGFLVTNFFYLCLLDYLIFISCMLFATCWIF